MIHLKKVVELEARLQTLMRFERAAALEDAARRVRTSPTSARHGFHSKPTSEI
jgi:hypothetical protein